MHESLYLELFRRYPSMQQIGEVCVKPIWETEPETDKGALSQMDRERLKRHSHCDISCSSNYHGVWDQGYAGGLQDRRVFVLIFVDCIEVSHLWLLSAWKWWGLPRSSIPCLLLRPVRLHSTTGEDDRKGKLKNNSKIIHPFAGKTVHIWVIMDSGLTVLNILRAFKLVQFTRAVLAYWQLLS